MNTLFNKQVTVTRVKGFTPKGLPRYEINAYIILLALAEVNDTCSEPVMTQKNFKDFLKGSTARLMKNGNIRFVSFSIQKDLDFIQSKIVSNTQKMLFGDYYAKNKNDSAIKALIEQDKTDILTVMNAA